MKMFESFNFDIIIILILISSTVSGIYFNLYRQGRRTLVLIAPFILLFFMFNLIYDNVKGIEFINNSIIKLINAFKITYQESAYALIIYFVTFIILCLLVRLFYNLFRVSVQKRVLNKASARSRTLGSFLGLLSGYVIGMLFMFILNPFIGLNYEKPITKIYTATSNDVLTFSSFNQLKNVNIKHYNDNEEILGELTGRDALNQYIEVLEIFSNFDAFINEFNADIIPNLSAASISLINTEDILNSFYLNANVIIEYEKDNPNQTKLKQISTYLSTNKTDLTLYTNLIDHDFSTIFNYLINNYDVLISELTNQRSIDKFSNRVSILKKYNENKDTYLSLINYESINIYEDVRYYEEELNVNTSNIISAFNLLYVNKDTEFLLNLNELFEDYQRNEDTIAYLNPKLSLSIKTILSDRYNYYFVNDSILKNKLLKSYIVDTITNRDTPGYEFYSEYIFYFKLASGVNLEDLSKNEFIEILINLNKLVSDGVLTKDQAKIYFSSLFSVDNKVFFGLLNDELIAEIKTIENEYLSEEVYAYLN